LIIRHSKTNQEKTLEANERQLERNSETSRGLLETGSVKQMKVKQHQDTARDSLRSTKLLEQSIMDFWSAFELFGPQQRM